MAQKNLCKFNITMFPWFAFGHMTPYLHLPNEPAQRGHKISFLLPKKAYLQLHHTNLHPHLITFHTLTIPHVHGLTPDTETASSIPIVLTGLLATAMDLMRHQVESCLRDLKPDFVFYDFTYWVPELASQIGCKTVCYNVVSATCLAIGLVPARKYPKVRQLTEAELLEPLLGYPSSTVMYRPHEAGSLSFMTLKFGASTTFYEHITTVMKQCDALSIRTCQEIEGSFCEYIGSQYGKPMFLTGPVLPEPPKTALEDWWAKWLGGVRAHIFPAKG